VTIRAVNMNVEDGEDKIDLKEELWIDCVRQDTREMDVSDEMKTDRG
jgi:hypothetical protein